NAGSAHGEGRQAGAFVYGYAHSSAIWARCRATAVGKGERRASGCLRRIEYAPCHTGACKRTARWGYIGCNGCIARAVGSSHACYAGRASSLYVDGVLLGKVAAT